MSSVYSKNLLEVVIKKSINKSWESAVSEWEIYDVLEDVQSSSTCVCGKENIRYLFTIRNFKNGHAIYPIGSSCIKKFNREDLNEVTSINEKLFKLFHAVHNNEFLTLNSRYFSKKLLMYLFDQGAFISNKYNDFNGENDFNFMIKMFNKRTEPTDKQSRKIRAIIVGSLKPYLLKEVNRKIKK